VLQPSHHFCSPSLDPFQQFHVLVLWAPELNTVLAIVYNLGLIFNVTYKTLHVILIDKDCT